MKSIKIWLSLITILYSSISYSQTNFQKIEFEKEKQALFNFVKEFAQQSDPVEIQKYIEFPYFQARHTCNPKTGDGGASEDEKTDSEIRKMGDCGCGNPIYFTTQKQMYNKKFRDSLVSEKTSIFAFYFQKKENILSYCKWLIKAYHFPRNTDAAKIDDCDHYEEDHFGQGIGTGVQIRGWGFSIISIIKINERYKVAYVGYVWD